MKSSNAMNAGPGPTLLSEVHAHHGGRTRRRHWRLWLELGAFGLAMAVVGLVILGGPSQPPPVDLSRAPAAAREAAAAAVTEPVPAAPETVETSAEAPPARPVLQGEPVVITVSRPIRE
jgi:hypothetical protein